MLIGYDTTNNALLPGKKILRKLTMEAMLFILINSPWKHLAFLRKALLFLRLSVFIVLILGDGFISLIPWGLCKWQMGPENNDGTRKQWWHLQEKGKEREYLNRGRSRLIDEKLLNLVILI